MSHLPSRTFSGIEPLEARIAPAANLKLNFLSIEFPSTAVPGDSGSITFTIENVGTTAATNKTCINIWLVTEPAAGSGKTPGDLVYDDNLANSSKVQKIVDGLKDVALNLAPNTKTGPIKKKFTLPDLVLGEDQISPNDIFSNAPQGQFHPFNMTPGNHFIVAEVDGAGENEGPVFLNPTIHKNNFAAPPTPFDYEYKFGTLPGRSGNVTLATTGGVFNSSTLKFGGPTADFTMGGTGTGEIKIVNHSGATPPKNNLEFKGTSAASFALAAIFKGANAVENITLNDIKADSVMKGLDLGKTDVTGNLTFDGALGGLKARTISPGKTLSIGGTPGTDAAAAIVLGRVNDLNLEADAGISVLQVVDWNKGGQFDNITAPFISDLSTTGDAAAGAAGDFSADLFLSGADTKGRALGEATFAGALKDCSWSTTATGGSIGDIAAESSSEWILNSASAAGDITIEKDLIGNKANPGLLAKSFGEIEVGGILSILIKATGGEHGKEIAIDSVAAHVIDGATIEASEGGVGKVQSGHWINGGQLTAVWIKKLITDGRGVSTLGDFTASLNIVGPTFRAHPDFGDDIPNVPRDVKDAVGLAAISGALKSGTWTVRWTIGTLTAGSIDVNWTLAGGGYADGNLATDIDLLNVKGAVAGKFAAKHYFNVNIGGEFSGEMRANFFASGLCFATFKAGTAKLGKLIADGEIRDLTVQQWEGGTLTANNFENISIIGSKTLPGNLKDVVITATGVPPVYRGAPKDAIEKISVKGSILNVDVDASAGPVGTISADEWLKGSLTTKFVRKLELTGVKGGAAGSLSNVKVLLNDATSSSARITIAGLIDQGSTIQAQGNLGTLQALGMKNATISAIGTNGIDKLVVTGRDAATTFFAATTVSATKIGSALIRNVDASGTGDPFGLTVGPGGIGNYFRAQGPTVIVRPTELKPADSPFDPVGKYKVVINPV